MKIISAIVLALNIAAPALAADFSDLQNFKASAMEKINPFPNPSNPDSCYLQGMKEGLCYFRCRSGETFQIKPVNPQAPSIYGKCGGGDYSGLDKQQMPDAGSILNQIEHQNNPFHQPQGSLEYCVFTEFKNNKCLFKCESGAILTEPAVKPDFSTGEPAGACATHIIRPIKPAFANKAVSDEQVYESYGRYPNEHKAVEVLNWTVNTLKSSKAQVLKQTLVGHGISEWGFRVTFKAASKLQIESSPVYRAELDAFERMFDMESRLEADGAIVATHEVASYEGGYYYVIGYFEGSRSADRAADKKIKACVFNSYAGNVCNYKCNDGSAYTQPLQTPGPWNNNPVQLCPQFVFPF
jgi:hypothetical protein